MNNLGENALYNMKYLGKGIKYLTYNLQDLKLNITNNKLGDNAENI